MGHDSAIEWTDHTQNWWEGCCKISQACKFCYAEARDARFSGGMATHWGPGAPRRQMSHSTRIAPFRWNREAAKKGVRECVFASSLSDFFDDEVPVAWRTEAFTTMRLTPNLDYLVLTKRPHLILSLIGASELDCEERMNDASFSMREASNIKEYNRARRTYDELEATREWLLAWLMGEAPENVSLGTSLELQEHEERVSYILKVAAQHHFVSCEPLLGRLDISEYLCPCARCEGEGELFANFDSHGNVCDSVPASYKREDNDVCSDDGDFVACPFCEGRKGYLDWVIVGGESGRQKDIRATHPDWVRGLRAQCDEYGCAFFFKQWGEYCPERLAAMQCFADLMNGEHWATGERDYVFPDGLRAIRIGKKRAGRLLDGLIHNETPFARPNSTTDDTATDDEAPVDISVLQETQLC